MYKNIVFNWCIFYFLKTCKIKTVCLSRYVETGIKCDSDTNSDFDWNILAVFVGFLHMNNSVNTL